MGVELRVLRYLVGVAEHGGFTAAARALHVSQPALSQQVRQLEAELGLQLLDRGRPRVALTEGGRLVVEHAGRMLEGAGRLREAVRAFRGLERGRLRLAVTQSFDALHLAPALATFLRRHPRIDVTALQWANAAIMAGVAEGALDLGVAFGPAEAGLAVEPLYRDRLMLACAADHPLARPARVAAGSLAEHTLAVLTPGFGLRRAVDDLLAAADVSPCGVVEMDTLAAILRLVRTGGCVSLIPAPPNGRPEDARDIALRELEPSPPHRVVQLVMPAPGAQSPAAEAFADILRAAFPTSAAGDRDPPRGGPGR